ncbi:NAD+ synthase [Caldivirga maquilingensis]|uniref:NH(3)-dependent NAD(+) synthetase n=1 Tax=Caldivirga maquilingensis (strain ATCC 700844 / DSM 13496 / JCM 10307 / IC-167) TaxID=397948 RepID=A8MDT0_CALMQ|nr:NAD+ synthase [Caldivirga maquilingensis]ABW01936.1 NAD+ synthetase [Caldivirga maquilingensis IC-167]
MQPWITLDRILNVNYDYIERRIVDFIRTYVNSVGAKGAVIGLSGGIDSSVTASLLVRALGKDKVLALIMPYKTTPPEDVKDAIQLAQMLGVKYDVVNIDPIRASFSSTIPAFKESEIVANGNILARIRMTILYYYANLNNMIVAGTGDKSELLIGYFTKYGDGGVDILPIGDVYKSQVRMLGRRLGLPDSIVTKPSSPRLWEGQTAEGELGVSYADIDVILHALVDLRMNPQKAQEATGKPLNLIEQVWRRVVTTEHKRRTPVVPRIGLRTIGLDWRMPVHYNGY